MPSSFAVKIEKGVIIPDIATLHAVMKDVVKDIKDDKRQATLFIKSPDTYLSSRGISSDLRKELLSEAGMKLGGGRLSNAGDCTVTCVCTGGCCVTCWTFTGNGFLSPELERIYPELKTAIDKVTSKRII